MPATHLPWMDRSGRCSAAPHTSARSVSGAAPMSRMQPETYSACTTPVEGRTFSAQGQTTETAQRAGLPHCTAPLADSCCMHYTCTRRVLSHPLTFMPAHACSLRQSLCDVWRCLASPPHPRQQCADTPTQTPSCPPFHTPKPAPDAVTLLQVRGAAAGKLGALREV